eukprot:15438461-Alexandrium_andersonii.AAC.1
MSLQNAPMPQHPLTTLESNGQQGGLHPPPLPLLRPEVGWSGQGLSAGTVRRRVRLRLAGAWAIPQRWSVHSA